MSRAYNVFFVVGMLILLMPICLSAKEPEFWDAWGDDQAEVSAYSLVQERYGELRRGRVVLIFVAEPFTRTTRVKPDPGNHPQKDIFYVLKLNHLRTFQTGVYPYRIMTSTFTHVDPEGERPRGSTTKVTFSSHEWCGQVFHQLLFDQRSIRSKSFSYFDKEADQTKTLSYPKDALVGDNLFITVRGLFGEPIKPGQSRIFDYLPTIAEVRLKHRPLIWAKASLHRSATPVKIRVPAGRFDVNVYTIKSEDRPTVKIFVESRHPNRIIGWEGTDGEKAELLGSERMKYWQRNKNQDEIVLKKLGITPQAS